MKALVFHRFGTNDVLKFEDVPEPAVLGARDVLVRMRAAGVNPVDWKLRSGGVARVFTGSRFPKILGSECSGEIAGTGSEVGQFKSGDHVIAFPGFRTLGAYAEFVVVPEHRLFPKPVDLGFAEAATIPIAGVTALQALRDLGKVTTGSNVLINGASGGVGMFAVQIAKALGARVTGVCSALSAPFAARLGCDAIIDYTKNDFTKGAERWDMIFDTISNRGFGDCKKVLTPQGVLVNTLPTLSVVVNQYLTGYVTGKKARTIWVKPNAPDVEWITSQISAGALKVVIDKTFAFSMAKEALAYSEGGRARGKIVIVMP